MVSGRKELLLVLWSGESRHSLALIDVLSLRAVFLLLDLVTIFLILKFYGLVLHGLKCELEGVLPHDKYVSPIWRLHVENVILILLELAHKCQTVFINFIRYIQGVL